MGSKSPIAIKICGITKVSQAKAIAALGVEAIGVIDIKSSPRFVLKHQRREIFAELLKVSPNTKRVWVVANLNDDEFSKELSGEGAPSVIQMHGDESPERCKELRNRYPHLEWWKALRVKSTKELLEAINYEDKVDYLVLDAWSKNSLGGTGQRIPLSLINEANPKTPWWLAGGISADWVQIALKETKPYGIDASSKLEKSPGIKDMKKVSSLIKAIKNID